MSDKSVYVGSEGVSYTCTLTDVMKTPSEYACSVFKKLLVQQSFALLLGSFELGAYSFGLG